MSITDADADISVAPHTVAAFEVQLPDRRRILSPGMVRAAVAALTEAIAQPTPSSFWHIEPAVAESFSCTAYAWRGESGDLYLDATGHDSAAVLSPSQAAQLVEQLAVWVPTVVGASVPAQRSRS